MTKKPRMGPSPCKMKGRHHGRLGSGAFYQIQNVRWAPQACECMERWRDIGYTDAPKASRRVSAYMSKETAAITVIVEPPPAVPQNAKFYHRVLPCNEVFRYAHSTGSKAYRKVKSGQSKFRGCQHLEDALLRDKEIRHTEREVLGTFKDFGLICETHEFESEGDTPDQALAREKNWEPKSVKRTSLDREMEYTETNVEFPGEDSSPERSEPAPKKPVLWTDYLKLHWKVLDLTYKQESAAKLFILENHDALTVGEVAKRLRISVDSLKDRINQIKKKVLARFPEAIDKVPSLIRKNKRERFESDLAIGGFYRKSLARHREKAYRLNPNDTTRRDEIKDPPKPVRRRSALSKKERDQLAKKWEHERLTTYIPTYDGVSAPWIPPGAKKNRKTTVLLDSSSFRKKLRRLREYGG